MCRNNLYIDFEKLFNMNINIDGVLNSFNEQDINPLGRDFDNYVNRNDLKEILRNENFNVIDFGKYYIRDKEY